MRNLQPSPAAGVDLHGRTHPWFQQNRVEPRILVNLQRCIRSLSGRNQLPLPRMPSHIESFLLITWCQSALFGVDQDLKQVQLLRRRRIDLAVANA